VVRIENRDSAASASGGETIFIGRTVEGWACGRPQGDGG
jgi:hypothetical protein